MKEAESRESNAKFNQEKINLEMQVMQLNHQYQELKMKSVLLMTEIERLHSIIHEKEDQQENLRERMSEMEIENFNKIQEIKKQVEDVIREKLVTDIYYSKIIF